MCADVEENTVRSKACTSIFFQENEENKGLSLDFFYSATRGTHFTF